MTFEELMKHPAARPWLISNSTWIVWEEGALFGQDGWAVYQRKPRAFKPHQVCVTDDEATAVHQFMKAAGIKESE